MTKEAPTPTGSENNSSNEEKKNTRTEVISFIKTIIYLLILAIFIRGTVVEAFKIPSGSMIPTLLVGDHILVSKLSFGFRLPFVRNTIFNYSTPERGDVVVFTRPDEKFTPNVDESAINIIKRVVAIAGDTIKVENGHLILNGEKVNESSFARWTGYSLAEGDFPETLVPEGHVFLMGDNRNHSRDSRFWEEPFLPLKLIKGRALIIYWSWDSLNRIGTIIR